jgi:hypothetical protein
MIRYANLLLLFIFQNLIIITLSGKQDTTSLNYLGFETGYCSYASIDEIFTPFLYTGNSQVFAIDKTTIFDQSIHKLDISYSKMLRVPADLSIKESFIILGQDVGQQYRWTTDPEFRESKTINLHIADTYFRCIPLQFWSHDKFYFGIKTIFSAILRPSFANPELISLTVNPGILYQYKIRNLFKLSLENYLNLLGLSIRRPYAGAEAQITNKYDFNYFLDYTTEHLQFDFFHNYFQFISQVKLEKIIGKRMIANINYQFNYLNLHYPRKLVSITTKFNVGLTIKIN